MAAALMADAKVITISIKVKVFISSSLEGGGFDIAT